MKKFMKLSMLVMLVASLLVACSGGGASSDPTPTPSSATPTPTPSSSSGGGDAATPEPAPAEKDPSEFVGTIDVWGSNAKINEAFMAKYPNVTVVNNEPDDHEDAALVAIAAGTGAPDVVQLHEQHYLKFRATEGLENLLEEPYNAGQYEKDYHPVAWQQSFNLNNTRMNGMISSFVPMAMVYRKDIFEQNGLPGEPDEVSATFRDIDVFFDAMVSLSAQGHTFFRWATQMADLVVPDTNFFDSELNWVRNTEDDVKAVELSQKAVQLGLVLDASSSEQRAAVNNGNMITYFTTLDSFSSFYTEGGSRAGALGNWRMAEVPGGYSKGYGLDLYAIPSQGKNKDIAWEYVKFVAMSPEAAEIYFEAASIPGYLPSWELPIVDELDIPGLGGQNIVKFGMEYLKDVRMSPRTPLYRDGSSIYSAVVEEGIANNQDPRTIVQQAAERADRELANRKAEVLSGLK